MSDTKKIETYSYKGWLISDSFVKRSFASLGYQIMGTIFVYLSLMAIGMVIFLVGLMIKSILS